MLSVSPSTSVACARSSASVIISELSSFTETAISSTSTTSSTATIVNTVSAVDVARLPFASTDVTSARITSSPLKSGFGSTVMFWLSHPKISTLCPFVTVTSFTPSLTTVPSAKSVSKIDSILSEPSVSVSAVSTRTETEVSSYMSVISSETLIVSRTAPKPSVLVALSSTLGLSVVAVNV